jgi:hypothetical protein
VILNISAHVSYKFFLNVLKQVYLKAWSSFEAYNRLTEAADSFEFLPSCSWRGDI